LTSSSRLHLVLEDRHDLPDELFAAEAGRRLPSPVIVHQKHCRARSEAQCDGLLLPRAQLCELPILEEFLDASDARRLDAEPWESREVRQKAGRADFLIDRRWGQADFKAARAIASVSATLSGA